MEQRLKELLEQAHSAVFFGGAGVSCESGIPDFRSQDGLYHQQWPWPPEEILSHTFFVQHTAEFFQFYREKMLYPHAKPNAAHLALARLERQGHIHAVVTQNIDGLHTAAGSRNVLELHGSVNRNRCLNCHAFMDLDTLMAHRDEQGIPRCAECGGLMKPEVVLYGEGLDMEVMQRSVDHIANADLLIVGGTSLVVYPAAGLLRYFRGSHLVLINRDRTEMDHLAELVIHEPIGQVLKEWAE